VKSAGIILAAGASRRMGEPKALLVYKGETFLDRLIGIFAAGCEQVIVVLGGNATAIRNGISHDAHFVINAEWELGQASSLQCGLAAASSDVETILFTPVDCPAINPGTVAALLGAYKPGASFVIPRFDGRRGHPVLFDAALKHEFLSLSPQQSAREIVHRYVTSTRYVDVEDPGILRDIDEPADYQALVGAPMR
jgi:molybdenum cofactor cytidylyltransferase